jgi:hypothetical protein
VCGEVYPNIQTRAFQEIRQADTEGEGLHFSVDEIRCRSREIFSLTLSRERGTKTITETRENGIEAGKKGARAEEPM